MADLSLDLTDWQRYCQRVRDEWPSLPAGPDLTLLASLVGVVSDAITQLRATGPDGLRLTLILPRAGWEKPEVVDGGSLLSVPVRIGGVAWPSLQLELPRA